MGLKDSKFAFLPHEEAVKRVKNEEIERIKLAFKRSTGSSNLLSKNGFIHDVLGDIVPSRLAEQIYVACGGGSKGISFKDVVCGLVLITCGSVEEKMKFIFSMISVDSQSITREDMENFFTACEGGTLPDAVISLLRRHEKVGYDEFYHWLGRNADITAVTRWLLQEQRAKYGVKLTSSDDTPSFYQSLANVTKLSDKDVIELEKRYWSLKSCSTTGKFDLNTFSVHISPPLPKEFCQGLFNAFDENNDSHIDFKEMVLGISTCCRGLTTDRLNFCFKVFDTDNDDLLSENELISMAAGLTQVYQEACGKDSISKSPEELVKELLVGKESRQLTQSEFRPWASTNKLIHEFLILLSQICHVVLGLRPGTKEEEGFIIKRWLVREERRGLLSGSLYYLIAMSWFQAWKEYVSYTPRKSTSNLSNHSVSSWVDIDSNGFVGSNTDSSNRQGRGTLVSSGSKRSGSTITPITVESSETSNVKVPKLTSTQPPGAVDNNGLLAPTENKRLPNLTGEGGKLKHNVILVRGRDFEVVPERIWRALFSWYGGNTALPRTVIVPSDHDPEPQLELYPVQLQLYRHAPPAKSTGFSLSTIGLGNLPFVGQSNSSTSSFNQQQPILVPPKRTLMYHASFSRKNTLKQILDFLSCRLKIRLEDMRLWDLAVESHPFLLEDENRTLEDIGIKDGHPVLLEVRNRDMSWPEEMNSLVATKNFRERSNTGPLQKGATGLHNLGNTCFMNSAVQCMSSTQPLTQYFLSKIYLYELNRTNPLGLKGILAKRYGELMLDLWSGMYRSIAPVKLRWTIGKYAPRFNGFQQHDSQELLSFLLDGLHEDLNRVHDKPYVELKDSDGRPDEEVAKEAWENHMKRNQSVVVDLFQGQLKSQVRCQACACSSVRFDPYTFLSLPIPMENSLYLEILLFRLTGSVPEKFGLLLSNDAKFRTLRKELSKRCEVPLDQIILAEVFGATVCSFPQDTQKLRGNSGGCIFAYEVTLPPTPVPVPVQSPSIQRSGPTISQPPTQEIPRHPEPAVLGGNSSYSNSIPEKRSPRKFRSKLPFRKKEKQSNEVRPAPNEYRGISHAEINLLSPGLSRTPSASSSTDCLCDLEDGEFPQFIIVVHRKMIQMDAYYVSWQKFRPSLFGTPVIITASPTTRHRDIYESVWIQVSRFITTTGSETYESSTSKYPFELKLVQKDGQFCALCPWYRFCRGCLLECDEREFNTDSGYLAIDWDPTTLHLNYQPGQERAFVEHSSMEESLHLLREPIDLDQCLKDFTKQEELGEDETWYCPKCKQHQTIAKKFDLWSLPPILIIHLKRFQLLNTHWIKSSKIVKFPMTNFDPNKYLVDHRKKHKMSGSRRNGLRVTVKASHESLEETDGSLSRLKLSPTSSHGSIASAKADDIIVDDIDSDDNDCNQQDEEQPKQHGIYNLYALSPSIRPVPTQATRMLTGGHYVAYARNPNGKWYCYNDSTCKEVDASVVENEAPYMLFYEREGLDISEYLPDIQDKTPDWSTDDDEFEKEVRRECVIQ